MSQAPHRKWQDLEYGYSLSAARQLSKGAGDSWCFWGDKKVISEEKINLE